MHRHTPLAGARSAILLFALLLTCAATTARAEIYCVVTGGGGQIFWSELARGAKETGEWLGHTVLVRGPNGPKEPAAQAAILDQLSQLGCQGLVLAPASAEVAARVDELKMRGVPSVFVDRDYSVRGTGGQRICAVMSDNREAGAVAARALASALGGAGTVALFRLAPGVLSTEEREQGFLDEARRLGLTVTLDVSIGDTGDSAASRATELLRAHQELDAVFSPNELTTMATFLALRKLGLHRVAHVGVDAHPRLLRAVRNGQMTGIVCQDPYAMGAKAVEMLHKAAEGEQLPTHATSPVTLVDRTTIASPRVRLLLAPFLTDSRTAPGGSSPSAAPGQ